MTEKINLGFFENFEDLLKIEKPRKSKPQLYFTISFNCESCGKQNQTLGYESVIKKGKLECRACACSRGGKVPNRKNWKDFSLEKRNQINAKRLKSRAKTYESLSKESFSEKKKIAALKMLETKRRNGTWNSNLSRKTQSRKKALYVFDNELFDSSWELAFYIYLKNKKISFSYHPDSFIDYKVDGVYHRYFPDFEVEGKLIEIKGNQFLKKDGTWQNPYDHSRDFIAEAKRKILVENKVRIMYYKDMIPYLDFVKQKYGETFIKKCQRSKNSKGKTVMNFRESLN